ncbi:MAG: biotin attachment protein [Hymenobacteraceae bacterium]|nr:biotin attachment protein [Hymenobacteraceae bacterium]
MLHATAGAGPARRVDLTPRGGGPPLLNDVPIEWDIQPTGSRTFHVLAEGRSLTAELVEIDRAAKTVRLLVSGTEFTVQLKDRFDLLLEQMGMSGAGAKQLTELKAPMPGLVVGVRVEPGQHVLKGEPLLVLEAMKMENILKAPADATVKAIRVGLRDNVQKGQVLITF